MPTAIGRGEAVPRRPAGETLYALEPDAAGQLDRAQLRAALEAGLRLACACGREANLARSGKRVRSGILWYVNCWRYRGRAFGQSGILPDACILYGAVAMPATWVPLGPGDAGERVRRLEARVERLERRVRRFTSTARGSARPPP